MPIDGARSARHQQALAARAARHRPAGGLPVRRRRSRDNIAFGRPDASHEDVQRRGAGGRRRRVHRRAPRGLRHAVGERGAALSIGQRQLIAFARALLADPRLLILDEATSSVDIATEAVIEEALARLLAGPHGVRRRPPPLDHPRRRPDRRARARTRRRAGHARGADGAPRALLRALRRLGRACGVNDPGHPCRRGNGHFARSVSYTPRSPCGIV